MKDGQMSELPSVEALEQMTERTVEYRNIAGEKICDVSYTLNTENEITTCVLIGPSGQRVDVFSYCKVPPATKVVLRVSTSGQSMFTPKRRDEGRVEEYSRISIQGIESPQQFGVFLHELGHAHQFENPEKRAFAELFFNKYHQFQYDWPECAGAILDCQTYFVAEKREYSEEEFPGEKFSNTETEFIRDFSKRYRVAKQGDSELTSSLAEKYKRLDLVEAALRHDATSRSAAVNDLAKTLRHEIADLMSQAQKSSEGLSQLYREWAAFSIKHIDEINRILRMVTIAMERDATAFALKQLRRVRNEFGISLLQEIAKSSDDMSIDARQGIRMAQYNGKVAKRWEEDCATARTVQEKFRASLRTHVSDNATVRKAYGAPPKVKKATL